MTTVPVDVADLDELEAYEIVNELNEFADHHDTTTRRTEEIEQSSRFILSTNRIAEQTVIIWRRRDGSAAEVRSVMIDEGSHPRVTPGQPITLNEEAEG